MPEHSSQAIAEELLPDATRRLIRTADSLADDEYAAPSGLPDWTRGHVLAHLALNAEGLAAALSGIVEGEPTPMYTSDGARDGDIADLAAAEPSAIRSRLLGATTDLADAFAAVPDDRWDTVLERVPGGRSFVASLTPVMRLQEVEIHHVDLATGYDRGSWAPAFAALLLDQLHTKDDGSVAFRAHATDLGRTWAFGDGGPTVAGAGVDLGWWITGRGAEGLTSDTGTVPEIGAW